MAAGDVTAMLVDQVRSRLGEPSKQGILDEEIYGYLSFAQRDVALRLNDAAIPELTPVATGSLSASRAPVPDSLQRIRLLTVGTNNIPATRWAVPERDAFTDNIYVAPSSDEPYYWLFYNTSDDAVRFHVEVDDPSSTDDYELHYTKTPDDVDGSTDPELNVRWHGLMVDLATALARCSRSNWAEYDRLRRKYLERARKANARFSEAGVIPRDDEPGDVGG